MRLPVVIILLFLLGCRGDEQTEYDLVIEKVNLIDGTGAALKTGVSIGIVDGKIKAIGTKLGFAHERMNGEGKFVIPGLFDCHVHTNDYRQDFPQFLHYGVTSVFITGGSLCTNEFYSAMREMGDQDSIPAPFVFHTSQHFTMEGRHPAKTYQSSDWRDGETLFYLRDTSQIEHIVKNVSHEPIVGIKLTIEDGPTPPFVERMPRKFIEKTVREAAKFELEVFAHVSDNYELESAIKSGVQNLVHFTGVNIYPEDSAQMELLNEFIKRDPFWVTTLMIDKSFLYPLNLDWFDNAAMIPGYRSASENVQSGQIERSELYLNRLMAEYDLKQSDLKSLFRPQVEDIQFLYSRGFKMVLGTDTGNDFIFPGYSLHEEMELLQIGGMEPLDILKMATLNAAEMLGAQDSLGSVEVNKLANLILLNDNPLDEISNSLKIHAVIKRGIVQDRIAD